MVKTTHSTVVQGYDKDAQTLKLSIPIPNILHPLGPESWLASNTSVITNPVKQSYSLLVLVSRNIYIVDIIQW
jgi:hypothetical protein